LGHLDFDIVSNFDTPVGSVCIHISISDFTSPRPSTFVENALQIDPFMQNKANFQKSQMNVNPYNTTDYENKSNWTLGENKPNSNPIQAKTNPIKANSNPISPPPATKQTQTNPIRPHAKRRAFIPCLGSNLEYNVGTQYPAANQNMYALQKP